MCFVFVLGRYMGVFDCVNPNTAIQLSQRYQLSGWIFTEGLANF